MSTVLVVSTYELGAQPLGIAGVAGPLRAAGHEVLTCDLSVEAWPDAAVMRAERLCCSVPMHTALRLGAEAVARVRRQRPELPVCYYGLYAEVARAAGLLRVGDEAIDSDEAARLVAWCGGGAGGAVESAAPDRRGLPGLESYARFLVDGESRPVATVAASSGCNHRCRHCPVPVVHDGRSVPVALEAIESDVAALVALGARHVHFADPDFLNRPRHAGRVVDALHGAHPELSFDATVKVSHVLRFEAILAELAAAGLCSVTTAFESTSDEVLARLEKGHSAADLHRCVEVLRRVGIEPRPSFLPFTPWTRREDLVGLFDFVASHDLVPNVDAVQYSIRLLLPEGSLLLQAPDEALRAALKEREPGNFGRAWAAEDRQLDALAATLAEVAQRGATAGEAPAETYVALRAATFSALSVKDPGAPGLAVDPGPRPERRGRLSEAWFCCAEPTTAQLGGVREPEPVFLGGAIARSPGAAPR